MTTYQILYWHDIPMQVRAREGRNRVSKPLSNRFQEAVDKASMAAGLTGTDDYLDHLNWGPQEESDLGPAELVEKVLNELESAHETIMWRETAADLGMRKKQNDNR